MIKVNDSIIKDYQKKIKLLKKYSKRYYNNDNPIVSDEEFDKLKQKIIFLEKKNKFLKKFESVNSIIGASPSNKFKKIKHLKPMLSLSNAFEKKDMEDFLSKIKNFLNDKNMDIQLSSEPKIDGISASLTYENGTLKKGLSRGDGVTGEDILENLMTIKDIPKKINDKNIPKILEVRGEVYIGKKDFKNINNGLC